MPNTTAGPRTGNLPAEVTRFIGRRRELNEVAQALERSRLVTLCGTGGVGKSRLALRTAAGMRREFDDGVWVVELSALREPALLARTVADALRLPDRSAGDPVDLLADHLAERRLLLVLDTCEHLVDACAMLAEILVRAAPGLRILATSREPLDVMGEHTMVISPLEAPDPEAGGPDEPGGSDSMRLFADRAAGMMHGFSLTPENRLVVARLCHRLDGIPLALELAAVRLRVMSIEQIVERLDDRFRLLGTTRTSQYRHQTLRAAVEWSHDLCTPAEQLLWARLSIFPGDFDLEAAENVCTGDDLPADSLFNVLGRLVEKSVVRFDQERRRYRMLDTLREFGAELLDAGAGTADLRNRHSAYVLALAERVAEGSTGERQLELLDRLCTEQHHLRLALHHLLSAPGQEAAAFRLLRLLHHFWIALGQFGEGREWLDRALDLKAAPEVGERGWVAVSASILAALQGDSAAAHKLAAEAARSVTAEATDDDAADLAAHVAQARAMAVFSAGELEEAKDAFEEAKAVYDRIGYREPYALACYPHLCAVHFLLGDFDGAFAVAEQGIRLGEATGERWNHAFSVLTRGMTRWVTGDLEGAYADAMTCLDVKEPAGDLLGIALSIDLTAACLIQGAEPERGTVLWGASQGLWQAMNAPMMGPHYSAVAEGVTTLARELLGQERFEAATRRGSELSLADAAALARSADGARAKQADPSGGTLTRREEQVADLVAEGLTNREIAERLVIAKRTVDSHLEHILAKLGFTSRTQIAVWAERRDPD